MHARDPHGILKKIFKLFLERGGKFIQTNVESLEQININETVIRSEMKNINLKKLLLLLVLFLKN